MNECVDWNIDGCKNGWINRKMHVLNESMDGWRDGWMDGWKDGQMDGWMGGWMDEFMNI